MLLFCLPTHVRMIYVADNVGQLLSLDPRNGKVVGIIDSAHDKWVRDPCIIHYTIHPPFVPRIVVYATSRMV